MLENGMHPDNYTLPYVLKSCANSQSFYLGSSVHGHCLQLGFSFDIFVGNTLIYMYAGFDKMEDARQVYDEIPCHCVVSWTVLISGYARKGDICTARLVFDEAPVKDKGIWGSMISGYVERIRLPISVRLGTALIDMYCKCGKLDIAENVFDEMPQRDTICWNAMISGVAMHGDGERAFMLFSDIERDGVQPDDSWSFEEAKNIVQKMANSSGASEEAIAWRALLSACNDHGQAQLAEVAVERLVQLECHSGAYVLLSNLYSAAALASRYGYRVDYNAADSRGKAGSLLDGE
ncbi:hypothetical protein RJ639_002381 [Escallonia herrerae]|uniref:Pentatricopeptide repeat-containing protein n=1 Tax=Escallonia herrerae TaxID=1293975 RepID=A0AA88XPZ3_9ASTE|nr:hypothetical protein RJ639_002381 [Escallonia herrerae]